MCSFGRANRANHGGTQLVRLIGPPGIVLLNTLGRPYQEDVFIPEPPMTDTPAGLVATQDHLYWRPITLPGLSQLVWRPPKGCGWQLQAGPLPTLLTGQSDDGYSKLLPNKNFCLVQVSFEWFGGLPYASVEIHVVHCGGSLLRKPAFVEGAS